MAKAKIQWDETDRLDVALSFKDEKLSITDIAKQLAKKKEVKTVSRHKVVALLQEAFRDNLVTVRQRRDKDGKTDLTLELLKERYKSVEFRLIYSNQYFSQISAHQVLTWLANACSNVRPGTTVGAGPADPSMPPMVAIGGGLALAELVEELPGVLNDPANEQLRSSLNLSLINVTSGGQPRKPEFNASYVSCRFGLALREALGGTKIAVVSHTTSMNPDDEEKKVVREAVSQTRAIVSGLGAIGASYCIDAIWPYLPEDEKPKVVGELLFHVFDQQGNFRSVDQIAAKDKLPDLWDKAGSSKRKPANAGSQENAPRSPMLTTLFGHEWLKKRTADANCSVIVVVNCKPDTKDAKARALRVVLESGLLTHVCLPADLADAVVSRTAT